MKRHIASIYILLMAAGISCTKESTLMPGETGNPDAVAFRSMSAETKVMYEDTPEAIRVSWLAKDRIGIFAATGEDEQANIAYSASASGHSTEFVAADPYSIVRWRDYETPHSFYAYYPYSKDAGQTYSSVRISLPAIQFQDGADNMEHLQEYDFLYAAAKDMRRQDDEAVPLHFRHLFTMLDIQIAPDNDLRARIDAVEVRCKDNAENIAFGSAQVNLETGEIDGSTVREGSSTVRLECGFLTNYDRAPQHFYIAMTPGHEGKSFDIVAILDSGEELTVATKTAPSGGFKASLYSVGGTISPSTETARTDLSADGTANTYIVNKGSMLYCFNATVKGNGIQRDYYTDASAQNLSIEPKSVLVLWYNCMQTDAKWKDMEPVVVRNTYMKDGYIVLETPFSFVEGNAVIAAFAEEGVTYDSIEADENGLITNATMLWSWNIWAVKDYDPEMNAVAVGDYMLMDRNLGALRNGIADESAIEFTAPYTIGNYYQWGRKDPFPHHADSRNYYPFYYSNLATTPTYTPVKALQKTISDKDGRKIEKQIFSNEGVNNTGANCTGITYVTTPEDYAGSVELATRNPHKFISDGGIFPTWVPNAKESTGTFSLWGDATADGEDDARKSIYDPCPQGWRLWTRQTAMSLRKMMLDGTPVSNDYGMTVSGMYFAYTGGGRMAQNNSFFTLGWVVQPQAEVNFMGWTATADCMDYAGGMHQRWYNWSLQSDKTTLKMEEMTTQTPNSGAAVGRTVRCVRMEPEVSFGGDGGMTGEDGKEEHGWYE